MSITSMIPEAHFDCLQMAADLAAPLGGVTRLEMQRIAFLACLLSIYTAQPVADWGYKFANTGSGQPYSDHLAAACEFLINTGALQDNAGRLKPSPHGLELLNRLSPLHSMRTRKPCVVAAAASLLAVPGSVMAEGLQQEPTMRASELRSSPTMLLDEPHLQTLHDHFAALATVIPPGDTDLLSPSVLWLSYMAHESEANNGDDDLDGPGGGSPPHPVAGDGGGGAGEEFTGASNDAHGDSGARAGAPATGVQASSDASTADESINHASRNPCAGGEEGPGSDQQRVERSQEVSQ